jgi:uncharacterized protein YdaU (DUF1376 family)
VNFYKHHIGDYAKKTGHLSVAEHGAYLLMLHAYYGTEKPLPMGDALYRLVRAQTKAERAAVDSVAAQFWSRTENGLVNGRAFDEIGLATQQADASRTNGNLGGRPKKTQQVSKTEPKDNLIQTPDSISQTPLAKESEKDTEPLRGLRVNGKHPKPSPKSPLPPDFVLTEPMRQQAITKFSDCDAQAMFEQFKAYHEREGSAYKSWPAAWTTWIGNAEKFGYPKQRTTERKWD